MNEIIIAEPLGLIDPANLKGGEEFLFAINYEMFPEKKLGCIKKIII